jgi:hypothetical protein
MEPNPLPYWIQIVQALAPTLIAIIALFITAFFTRRQWKTAHDKLKLDLFEKRYAIYDSLKKVLAETMIHGNCNDREIMEFVRASKGAEFLFEKDMVSYFEQVRKTLNHIQLIERELEKESDQAKRKKLADNSLVAKNWIDTEFREGAENRFTPYLSFAHLKH